MEGSFQWLIDHKIYMSAKTGEGIPELVELYGICVGGRIDDKSGYI